MTALFTIVESYRADLDALNAMDIDAATYADTLDGMQGELQDKLRAVIAYSLDLEIEATGAAAASKRITSAWRTAWSQRASILSEGGTAWKSCAVRKSAP